MQLGKTNGAAYEQFASSSSDLIYFSVSSVEIITFPYGLNDAHSASLGSLDAEEFEMGRYGGEESCEVGFGALGCVEEGEHY